MEERIMTVLLVLCFAALAYGQVSEPVPCLTSRANCSVGISSVSVINNNYFCCAAGYSMSWTNNGCSCRQTSEVIPCGSGPQACRNANSFSSDGNGNTRCCQNGYSMSTAGGFVNGQYFQTCTCTRPLAGWGGGVVVSNGGNVFVSSDPNFNQTEFDARMRQWGQRFSNQMKTMSDNLNRNLGNLFRNLRSLG